MDTNKEINGVMYYVLALLVLRLDRIVIAIARAYEIIKKANR
ncbi:hypothetical protein [Ligilactobacillus salivarius]|nr:hypothetical protein [Ligilactobacillus salivarius]